MLMLPCSHLPLNVIIALRIVILSIASVRRAYLKLAVSALKSSLPTRMYRNDASYYFLQTSEEQNITRGTNSQDKRWRHRLQPLSWTSE